MQFLTASAYCRTPLSRSERLRWCFVQTLAEAVWLRSLREIADRKRQRSAPACELLLSEFVVIRIAGRKLVRLTGYDKATDAKTNTEQFSLGPRHGHQQYNQYISTAPRTASIERWLRASYRSFRNCSCVIPS
jgi:hypothetical protein